MMTLVRMLTGLLSLVRRRREKPDTDAIFRAGRNAGLEEAAALAEAVQAPDREPCVHGGRGMPEDRARFVAAFLKRAFRGREAISIFCHEDRPFPDIRAGGKVDGISVYGSGDEWRVNFGLNDYVWFVDGHVDIELERNAPMLRVSSAAPSGAKIQLVFMPEDGYGPIRDDSIPGDNHDDYDLWANARRALDQHEYSGWDLFEFAPEHEHQFSCTCCHGATCPLHDEGIKRCVTCGETVGEVT